MNKIAKKDIFFVSIQLILLTSYLISINYMNFNLNIYIKYSSLLIVILSFLMMFVATFQLNKSLTAFPTPKTNGKLIKTGVYKYIRHPIYSGIIISTLFFGIYSESSWKIFVSICLFVLFYFKSNYEENLLTKFYSEYFEYKKHTFKFFPFIF